MTYSESANGLTMTRERALQELEKHHVTSEAEIARFHNEIKTDQSGLYDALAVLQWLGY